MSDDQDQPRQAGDAGTERALAELRVALEQLAARMGAGFREDLAQIRAIAASVADRDLTADIEALRVDVATLVGRDSATELQDEFAALRAELARVASSDDVSTALRSELAPLQSAVDRIGARLDDDSGRTQVLARFEALEARLDQLAGGDASAEVLARLDALSERLDTLPTAQQVANLSGDLRAHLADGLADFDGDAVVREIAAVRAQLGDGHGSLLEDLQDNLADVASGEVVGALWDEVRSLRADLPDLIAQPEPFAAAPAEPDPQLGALTSELAVLRNELAEGLVVEPSDALTSSLDALRGEIDGLRSAIGELRAAPAPTADVPTDDGRDQELLVQLAAVRAGVDELQARLDEGLVLADDPDAGGSDDSAAIAAIAEQVASLRGFVGTELDDVRQAVSSRLDAVTAQVAASPQDDARDEQLLEQLGSIRAGLDEVRARQDEVPVHADEPGDPSALGGPGDADLESVADQVASLRDFVSSELDTLRQTVSARLDAAAEATAATVAEVAARPGPEATAPVSSPGGIDPETVEVLRDEIRTAGAIGDQVVDALREELKALRRRIAVKASERVLDDQQLAQIADAVAARLAPGGAEG